jgi:hypothetical protein
MKGLRGTDDQVGAPMGMLEHESNETLTDVEVESVAETHRYQRAEHASCATGHESDDMSLVQRVLRAPLVAHATTLGVLLLVLLPVIGTTSQYSADEGAAIAQAVRLEHGDGWTMPNSFPAADPNGEAFPLELSAHSGNRFAPFAKHPLYPVVLAAADEVGGRAGMVVLSIVGTLVAAFVSALLARRVDPSLAVPALWAVGIASPLLFDGYVVIAHTLGAACAAGAALLLLRQLSGHRSWIGVAGAAALLLVGTMFRTEMLFMGLAFAVAIAIVGIRRKATNWMLAVVPAAAVLAGFVFDWLLQRLILKGEGATTTAVAGQPGGLISGRLMAFVTTWLRPSYASDSAGVLVLAVAVLTAVAVLLARRTPPERDGVRLFVALSALAAVARLLYGGAAVPGLLVAFPLCVGGIAAFGRDTFVRPSARFLAASFALFAAGVLATQYASGGSGEWGGRYFAIGLPLLVPVLLLALRNVGQRLDKSTIRIAAASALVVSVASCALAVVTLRDAHKEVDRLVTAVDLTAQQSRADDGGRPVVLTTDGSLARFAFPLLDQYRWLTVPSDRLVEYAQRLRDLDVGPVTFVSRNASDDLPKLDGLYTARERTEPLGGWLVTTLGLCPSPNECSPNG